MQQSNKISNTFIQIVPSREFHSPDSDVYILECFKKGKIVFIIFPPLLDISYTATANHYWVFKSGSPQLSDKAPAENFLTKSLFDRFDENEFESVDNEIKNDFADGSLFTPLVSMTYVSSSSLSDGMYAGDSKSVLLNRNSKTQCAELVSDTTEERPYFQRCLRNPEDCEYGLSVSLWVYFLTSTATNEQTLISTGISKILDLMYFNKTPLFWLIF